MAVPYTFGTTTASIPLSQFDSNWATAITLGNTAIQLGNTVTTLNNMTLANVTISSGNITLTNYSATTANITTANVVTLIVTGNETVQGNTSVTGTATAAKFIPTGNSATGNGMYLPATNAVGISTNGTNAVYIDASQNVGIGTTSPSTKFHVVGVITATQGVGGTPAFSAYLSANQTVTTSTFTLIQIDTKEFDTASRFNNTGSTVGGIPAYSFLPNVAGYYQVSISTYPNTTVTVHNCYIYKNGVQYKGFGGTPTSAALSTLLYLNGSSDYISLYIFLLGATPQVLASSILTFFNAALVRGA